MPDDLNIVITDPDMLHECAEIYREMADFVASEGNAVVAAELRQMMRLYENAELAELYRSQTPNLKRDSNGRYKQLQGRGGDR